MDQNLIMRIEERLREVVNPKRYQHTLGVVEAAVYLADKYHVNREDARIAAYLHDFAKDFTKAELMDYIEKYGIEVDPLLLEAYQLLHGKIAADIAKREFHIENEDILKAIENHTTGDVGMSPLEKIIYVADFIEVGRDYPGVEDLRILAEEDLDKAMLQAIDNTIRYVISIKKLLHPKTVYARNEILQRLEGARD